jgi:hypothetical protein
VLVIGKRVKRAITKRVPPQLYILLQVGVLIGGGKRGSAGGDSINTKLCGYQQYPYY